MLGNAVQLLESELLLLFWIQGFAEIALAHASNGRQFALREVMFLQKRPDILLEQFKIQF